MYIPTVRELKKANKTFLRNEPRDIFYRAANELVELAIQGNTKLTLSEAIATLLQSWNKSFYQYRKFDNKHFQILDKLLDNYS